MAEIEQLSFFNEEPLAAEKLNGTKDSELGTFKDSMRAPVHSWFRYPAGYSYKFVEKLFDDYSIQSGDWVYDPFSGTGTTLVCAKQKGINAYGVEAHSFVHWVADVKLNWNFDLRTLGFELERLLQKARNVVASQVDEVKIENEFPELIYKCYHPQDLKELYLLRGFITNQVMDYQVQDLLKLALTDTLRNAAAAGTGWPYIAPNKNTGDKPPKKATTIFETTVRKMYADVLIVSKNAPVCEIHNVLGDSRQTQSLSENCVKLALTSPPYLNNYDYADRTRLETYFWGITKSWKDITDLFRNKLMVAATTQIVRSQYQVETALSHELRDLDSRIYTEIQEAVLKLSQLRRTKGGKKDYDLMVALYFNDILQVIRETYRLLQTDGKFYVVIGDSAPYGVHIHTEDLIGRLGLALGFRTSDYKEFRARGGKWKANPQRHSVPLREGVVILSK